MTLREHLPPISFGAYVTLNTIMMEINSGGGAAVFLADVKKITIMDDFHNVLRYYYINPLYVMTTMWSWKTSLSFQMIP